MLQQLLDSVCLLLDFLFHFILGLVEVRIVDQIQVRFGICLLSNLVLAPFQLLSFNVEKLLQVG